MPSPLSPKKFIPLGAVSVLILFLLFFTSCQFNQPQSKLTNEQSAWLSKHPVIRLAPDPDYPPIDFFNEANKYTGLSAEYVRLIEAHIGRPFKIVRLKNFDQALEQAQRRRVDIICTLQKNQAREKYLHFSEPIISVPNVIITGKRKFERLKFENLKKMRVCAVKGHTVLKWLERDHPDLKISLVESTIEGLTEVSFGVSDAMIAELPTASYVISQKGITNLKVAGDTGYNYDLRIGVRKDWPILKEIINTALAGISDDQRKEIKQHWISFDGYGESLIRRYSLELGLVIGFLALIFLIVLVWNLTLKKQVSQRTQQLLKELEDRKQAEKRARQSELKYKGLVNNIVGASFRCQFDHSYSMEFMSDYIQTITGYDSKSFVSEPTRSLRDIIIAQDRKPFREALQNQIEKNLPFDLECRIVDSKGGVHWLQVRGQAIKDNQGMVQYIDGAMFDITQRKEAEKQLNYFEKIVATSNDFLILVDQNLFIKVCNQKFADAFELSQWELKGKNLARFFIEILGEDQFLELAQSSRSQGNAKTVFWYLFPKQVHRKLLKVMIYPEKTANGSLDTPGYLINIRDITKINKLEVQLRQAAKLEAIGTLAGGIAHDFNNILSAIIGYTELTLRQNQETPKVAQNMEEVLKAAERAQSLIAQILTFSRQDEQAFQAVQLGSLVKEALKLLKASLPSTIEMKLKIESDLAIMADPTQIHQVVMNICTNAGHAMLEKGGVMTVQLTSERMNDQELEGHPDLKPGRYLKLTVSDTGIGMSQEVKERIFEPFFTTKDKGKGTGLGLSVVHGIVKSHGGDITVYSEPNQGSAFNILFPAIDQKVKAPQKAINQIPKGNEKILLVDDEQVLVDIGKMSLEVLGYQVVGETSSLRALEIFNKNLNTFDLVITDMTMPKMTGEELCKNIRKLDATTPVIICTGFSSMLDKKKLAEMGADGLLPKPVKTRDMALTIRKILDEKGPKNKEKSGFDSTDQTRPQAD